MNFHIGHFAAAVPLRKDNNMAATSKSERAARPFLATLGGISYATFSPYLPTSYLDAADARHTGLPDSLVRRRSLTIFIEWKSGALNDHRTKASSYAALQAEYDGPARSYKFLSDYFWNSPYRSGVVTGMKHCFNQSLFKVLALQSLHGWRSYIVCFDVNPKPEDAQRYSEVGLVWCTAKTLDQLLLHIELANAGCAISFVHRTTKYAYKVIFDNGTATPEEARTLYLATVDHAELAEIERNDARDEALEARLAAGYAF
jgi:hypothetical protein